MSDCIKILHISDLHLEKGDMKKLKQNYMIHKLLNGIEDQITEKKIEYDIIAITGDLTQKGSSDQFDEFKLFLNELINITHVKINDIFVIPGNHDKNKDYLYESASCLKDHHFIDQNKFEQFWNNKEDKNILFNSQQCYFDSFNRLFTSRNIVDNNKPYYFHDLNFKGHIIRIIGYNSSWLSLGQKNENNLLVGKSQMLDCLENNDHVEIIIALMHHPLKYLRDYDSDFFEQEIMEYLNILLLGHLHKSRNSVDLMNDVFVVCAGPGSLKRKEYVSYNILSYCFETHTLDSCMRNYDCSNGGWSEVNKSVTLMKRRKIKLVNINPEIYKQYVSNYKIGELLDDIEFAKIIEKYISKYKSYKDKNLETQCDSVIKLLDTIINESDLFIIYNKIYEKIEMNKVDILKFISTIFLFYLNNVLVEVKKVE